MTANGEPPGMATQHIAEATCMCPSHVGPLHLFHLLNLSFIIGMPNKCCILELGCANVLQTTILVTYVQIGRKKPVVLCGYSTVRHE